MNYKITCQNYFMSIMKITRQTTGITLDDFLYGNKTLPVIEALRLFCYKAYGPYCTYREIGVFTNRSLSAVAHHVKTFSNLLSANDPQTVEQNKKFDKILNSDREEATQ